MSDTGSAPVGSNHPLAGAGGHALAWLVLAVAVVALFATSYQRWGHPIIDLGRELVLPSQLLEGRVLYREVLYNYGPVTPYLLAGIVAAAGDSLVVFQAVGLAICLWTLGALYLVGVEWGGVATGFTCGLLFLVLCGFANSTWGCNFILPYSFSATLGLALALSSFHLLQRHIGRGRRARELAGSVALALLAVGTKIEIGLAIVTVLAVVWWAHRLSARMLLAAVVAALALAAATGIAFAARSAGEHALLAENLAKFTGTAFSDPFFRSVAGLDRPGFHLTLAVTMGIGLVVLIALADRAGGLAVAWREGRRGEVALACMAGAALVPLIWVLADVRILALSVLAAPVVLVLCAVRERRDPLLPLAAFVLASAPRILLQYHPVWYGFTLSVPAIPLAVYGLGVRLPGRLAAPGVVRLVLLALAAVLLFRFESANLQRYRAMTAVLETPKGRLRDFPVGRARAIQAFLSHVEQANYPPGTDLVVFPEGISLNYFTSLPNPTSYQLFTPPEIRDRAVESRILGELRETRPELVVLTARDLREFGSRGFGQDYARGIGRWIRQSYRRQRVFGRDPGWTLELWQRRDVSAPPGG